LKPSLVYAILIVVVVVVATLYARSNSPVPKNLGTPIESSSNESKVQEVPTSKQETGSDTKTESGDKAVESVSRNTNDKE
jgi:cytoskeletal protein RodZ